MIETQFVWIMSGGNSDRVCTFAHCRLRLAILMPSNNKSPLLTGNAFIPAFKQLTSFYVHANRSHK
jgi:hypothetical protein